MWKMGVFCFDQELPTSQRKDKCLAQYQHLIWWLSLLYKLTSLIVLQLTSKGNKTLSVWKNSNLIIDIWGWQSQYWMMSKIYFKVHNFVPCWVEIARTRFDLIPEIAREQGGRTGNRRQWLFKTCRSNEEQGHLKGWEWKWWTPGLFQREFFWKSLETNKSYKQHTKIQPQIVLLTT